MVAPDAVRDGPNLSVIVPARNEEAALGACLDSLLPQTGTSFEIIVVDDASTDRTREIAQALPVRLVNAPPLPDGWVGKNNAVAAGAREARGLWLLFTDADTVHLPGSLTRGLSDAQEHGASLVSYSPAQEVHGILERAVMPVIFAELAASYRPSDVNNPASPAAAANGQYLLISREAYQSVGGHAAIARDLLEDVALARAVKRSGRKIYFRFGGDVVRTRMYRSFAQLREGWTKNLVLLFARPVRLAVMRLLEFLLIVGCVVVGVLLASKSRWQDAMLLAGVAAALLARFLNRVLRAHFPWDCNLFALLGLPLFAYLLLRSWFYHRKGVVTWKGRPYRPAESGRELSPLSGSGSRQR